MNSTPSSTPSQGTQLVGWPLQAGLARTEFSQFFSFTGTVQSTFDVWCGRLLKMTFQDVLHKIEYWAEINPGTLFICAY